MAPVVGLNLAVDMAFVTATKPLFAAGLVDAIEWDIDSPWVAGQESPATPLWVERLLDLYASANRLYGHSVWMSVLTGHQQARQAVWLERLAHECARRPYRFVSEHFGFMSAGPYVVNTLLPVPYVAAAVAIGRERLRQLGEATTTDIGLENMAGALSPADAVSQSAFLDDLLAPVRGFLLLDLHNVFTQAANLGLDAFSLLASFPCDRVREIHLSGGRWLDIEGRPFRFDSHNDAVPSEVFALLSAALSLCPNVEVVILERRAGTLGGHSDFESLRADYRRIVEIVAGTRQEHSQVIDAGSQARNLTAASESIAHPRSLARYQDALVDILAREASPRLKHDLLLAHPDAEPVRDYVATFLPRCIAATSLLVRRWAKTQADVTAHGVQPNLP